MNQTKFLLISMAMLGILISSACASQPAPSIIPASTNAVQPDVSTSIPVEGTSVSGIVQLTPTMAPASTMMVQPNVSTSIPAESTSSAGGIVQIAPDTPPGPSVGEEKTVTLDDRGKTVSLAVGDDFLLKLGEQYTWDISVSDQSIISRIRNITVIRGAQGVYHALKPGTATLTASGDPLCRQSQPACAMPSILFEVTIEVK